jgi:hypothetical protein
MKKLVLYVGAVVVGLAFLGRPGRVLRAVDTPVAAPTVFQTSGSTVASIQSVIDEFRAALGGPDNGDATGPISTGRREIDWSGSRSTATSPVAFDGFLNDRGVRFTASETGAVNVTRVDFFVPGGGELAATTTGFGAIFADADRADSTVISFFGVQGELLFTKTLPRSTDADGLTFLGVVFADARIATVRITHANRVLDPDGDAIHDVVMVDDFVFGEPQPVFDSQ